MNRSSIVWGLFFVLMGIAFLGDTAGLWTMRAAYVLPIALIILGVAILLGGTTARD